MHFRGIIFFEKYVRAFMEFIEFEELMDESLSKTVMLFDLKVLRKYFLKIVDITGIFMWICTRQV